MKKDTISIEERIEQQEKESQHLAAAMQHIQHARTEYASDAAQLLDELAAAGFPIRSISDLIKWPHDYASAVPILLKWLPAITNKEVKHSIVRALTIKGLRKAITPALLDEFERLSEKDYHFVKWQIGSAMSMIADDAEFDRIASLLRDKRHGTSRQMLAVSLGKMKKRAPDAVQFLNQMLEEDDMPGHVIDALRKLNGKEARVNVERYLNHKMAWVRNEAKKAIAKFDKTP